MRARLSIHSLFLLAFPVLACGGSTKQGVTGVPSEGGAETSVPLQDAGVVHDATPGVDAAEEPAPVGPGLLLFAGYGDDRTLSDQHRLERTDRQFFVKLSYAFQR